MVIWIDNSGEGRGERAEGRGRRTGKGDRGVVYLARGIDRIEEIEGC